jgi:hypothetical protein
VLEDESFHSKGQANGRKEKQKEELGTKEETTVKIESRNYLVRP